MTDPVELLRAANPVPDCEPPSIETLRARIDHDAQTRDQSDTGELVTDRPAAADRSALPAGRSDRGDRRLPSALALALASIPVIVVVGALALLGGTRKQTTTTTRMTAATAAYPVLRRTDLTAADLALRAAVQYMRPPDKDAQLSGVRSAYRDRRVNVGVMPDGPDKVCLLAVTRSGEFSTCEQVRDTHSTGLQVGFQDSNGYYLAGVVPAGFHAIAVSRAGRGQLISHWRVSRDGGFAFFSRKQPGLPLVEPRGG